MNNPDTPADPQQLRSEIVRTRAELADTVKALAGKVDVKARAKHAAGDAAEQARQRLASATDRATQAAGVLAETAAASKGRLEERVPPRMRRQLPWAALCAGSVLVGVLVLAVRRRRV
jgi:hypothetical protein